MEAKFAKPLKHRNGIGTVPECPNTIGVPAARLTPFRKEVPPINDHSRKDPEVANRKVTRQNVEAELLRAKEEEVESAGPILEGQPYRFVEEGDPYLQGADLFGVDLSGSISPKRTSGTPTSGRRYSTELSSPVQIFIALI